MLFSGRDWQSLFMVVMIRTLKMSSPRRQAAHKSRNSGAIEGRGLRKRMTQRNCTDGKPVGSSEVPSFSGPDSQADLKIENNTQRSNMATGVPNRARLWNSLPPTGGIALLIEILAREALKKGMAKKSKGGD